MQYFPYNGFEICFFRLTYLYKLLQLSIACTKLPAIFPFRLWSRSPPSPSSDLAHLIVGLLIWWCFQLKKVVCWRSWSLRCRLVIGSLIKNIAMLCPNTSLSKGLWGSRWLSQSTVFSLVGFKRLWLTADPSFGILSPYSSQDDITFFLSRVGLHPKHNPTYTTLFFNHRDTPQRENTVMTCEAWVFDSIGRVDFVFDGLWFYTYQW